MKNRSSDVDFATISRVHFALRVRDLEASVEFYRALLQVEPAKQKPGYAKFEPQEPPLNLALVEQASGSSAGSKSVGHFGIQVKSSAAVSSEIERLAAAGLQPEIEEQVSCCHAVQDKGWVRDPDGNQWEIFVVTDDQGRQICSAGSVCC